MSSPTTSSACKASCFLCMAFNVFGAFGAFGAFGRLRRLERKVSLDLISYALHRHSLVLVSTEQFWTGLSGTNLRQHAE